MFLVFLVFLALFHLGLVRTWPLGKRAWKKVDYIWLSVAALGILGSAAGMRRDVATNFVRTATVRAQTSYEGARDQLEFLSGPAVCRKFIATEFSPSNLSDVQEAFDRVCEFARQAISKVPMTMTEGNGFPSFGDWPNVREPMLQQMFGEIDAAKTRYELAQAELNRFRNDAQFSVFDEALLFFSPFMLAIALALRLTKVTGELRLEP